MRIFLDTNIFMYTLGAEHPLRQPSWRVLDLATENSVFYTNAEVYQEVLHRYLLQKRWTEVKRSADAMFLVMDDRMIEVLGSDVRDAGALALTYPRLQARDLIHLAIMNRVGARHVVSADRAFEGIEGIERLDPLQVDEWASLVAGN